MPVLILFAVLQGYVSIPPIHVFQPYKDVKCPHGYSVWWPAGQEFDNDRYAECIKPIVKHHVAPSAHRRDSRPAVAPVSTTNISLENSQRAPR
jgi:hypothetical protein